jgi:integrase
MARVSRSIHRLSAKATVAKRLPGYYADGAGLYLQVAASAARDERGVEAGTSARSWIFRFDLNQRRREMGLGPLSIVSLAEARSRAAECRKLLHEGKDPLAMRRASQRRAETQAQAAQPTQSFDECAAAYIEAHRAGWRSAKHAIQWEQTLRQYAAPVIGKLPVSVVTVAHVKRILEPIWRTKTETAVRLRGRIESVLSWATVHGYRSGDNPARWRGHLDQLLPLPTKVSTPVHHAALPYAELPAFMVQLRAQQGLGARALEFAILTATRSGEVRGAEWAEIDIDQKIWTIPGTRMKAGKEHRVPISDAALEMLKTIAEKTDSDLVFASERGGKLSDMTLLAVLRRMNLKVVPHGFRSTFRDWCAEQTEFTREVAEMSLAHAIGNKVEAAYRRGDLLEKRSELMHAWARYCLSSPHVA